MAKPTVPLTRREPMGSGLLKQQDPHSAFLAAVAILLALTLVLDMLVQPELLTVFEFAVVFSLCLLFAVLALFFGKRVPRWVGLSAVAVFVLASAYFLSPLTTDQSAVSTLQELPLIGLYLGWFVDPLRGRLILAASLSVMIVAMVFNPLFAPEGGLGPSIALGAVVIAVLCFEIGVALWTHIDRKSRTDALTGVLNRRGFLQVVESDLARAHRTGHPMVLVVIDFDGLKRVNDTRGHAAGDRMLIETAEYWRRAARGRDVIGRTGGDEFAILLDRVDLASAGNVMRRLRAGTPHPWSWGAAQAGPGLTLEQLFQRADAELYAQKAMRP